MSDMDWRIWLYDRLSLATPVTDLVPETSIYGAGSMDETPSEKPFLVVQVGQEFYSFPGKTETLATIWAHDSVGNYLLIDSILDVVRDALCGPNQTIGQVSPNGICKWASTSPDQADQGFGTLMKHSTYQLFGRNGND